MEFHQQDRSRAHCAGHGLVNPSGSGRLAGAHSDLPCSPFSIGAWLRARVMSPGQRGQGRCYARLRHPLDPAKGLSGRVTVCDRVVPRASLVRAGAWSALQYLRADAVARRNCLRQAIAWIVPKAAVISDDAALFVPDRGFVALGRVATAPEPTTFGKGPAYRAGIDALRALGRVVALPEVLEVAPIWKWPTYPRSRATVPTSVESLVRRLLDSVLLGERGRA